MGTLIIVSIPAARLASTMKLAITLLLVVAASALPNKVAVNRGANGLDWTAAMRGQTREECIDNARNEVDSCFQKAEEKTTACKESGRSDNHCSRYRNEYGHMCHVAFEKQKWECRDLQ